MRAAIACNDPVVFIENILCYGLQADDPGPNHIVPLGKAAVALEGSDVSIITYGRTVLDALEVAGQLRDEGISAEVIDLRTIAPFDEAAVLASVKKTGRAIVLHEAVKAFGTGAEISARINEKLFGALKAPVQRIGGAFSAVPMANALEQAWIPTKDEIKEAARAAVSHGV
jgi:pyruvate dehydrogenase E1 component beta subunit